MSLNHVRNALDSSTAALSLGDARLQSTSLKTSRNSSVSPTISSSGGRSDPERRLWKDQSTINPEKNDQDRHLAYRSSDYHFKYR